MTTSYLQKVDGFLFGFTIGSCYWSDGVSIPFGTSELDNPKYIDALRKALELWKQHEALSYLREYLRDEAHGERRGTPDEYLYKCKYFADFLTVYGEGIPDDLTEGVGWLRQELAKREGKQQRTRPGYVYILKSATGERKIGRTVDPNNRLKTFSVKLPFRVEYEALIECTDAPELERTLHMRFASKHIDGEWFSLDDEDVEAIRTEFIQ